MNFDEHFNSFLSDDEIKKLLGEEFSTSEELDINTELSKMGIDLNELEKSFENYQPKLELGYSVSHTDAVEPKYNYDSDSGFDLHSTTDLEIPSFGRVLVPTGLSFDIKDGYEIQVRSKSGLALKQGLMVLNSPGTVDQGYTGEVKVILMNMNNMAMTVDKGQKIAQAVLCSVESGKKIYLHHVE